MRDRSQISRIVVCAAQLIATGVAAASAITSTWLGGTGNWNDATRWTAGIPDAGYQVLVDGGNPFSSVVTNISDSRLCCPTDRDRGCGRERHYQHLAGRDKRL